MLKAVSNIKKGKLIALSVIIILHIVGTVGIGVFKNEGIIELSWVNLSLTFCIGLFFFEAGLKKLILPLIMASIIGILAEGIGVNYGYLFGDYKYSSLLGFNIFNVPFTIGLLWAGLNIAAKNIASRILSQPILIAILAACLMVVFDIIMEPSATALNFWNWQNETIPIFNYISWFFVSLLIQLLWQKVNTKNDVFDAVFIIQASFFIALNSLL